MLRAFKLMPLVLVTSVGGIMPFTPVYAQNQTTNNQQQAGKAMHDSAVRQLTGGGNQTNLQRARVLMKQAADQGYGPAQVKLSQMILMNIGGVISTSVEREKQASDYLYKAARQNYEPAYYFLGKLLLEASRPVEDFSKGHWYIQRATSSKAVVQEIERVTENQAVRYTLTEIPAKSMAKILLADCISTGKGVSWGILKAKQLYESAIQEGQQIGYSRIGLMFLKYDQLGPDPDSALDWFYRGMEAGDEVSEAMYGYMMYSKSAIRRNQYKGHELLENGVNQNLAEAHYRKGLLLEEGLLVEKNLAQARSHYSKATQAGHGPAALKVAIYLQEVMKNPSEGQVKQLINLYIQAGRADVIEAQLFLAQSYEDPQSLTKYDQAESHYWWVRLANQTLDAQHAYKAAMTADKLSSRRVWLREAANRGHFKARVMFRLITGSSSRSQRAAAEAELTQLYNDGHIGIAYDLGLLYANSPQPEDGKKAIDWLTRAGEDGRFEAYRMIGKMYARGDVVEEDLNKARENYMKAASGGDLIAMIELANAFDTTPNELERQWELGYQRLGKNPGLARGYWTNAAKAGSMEAKRALEARQR